MFFVPWCAVISTPVFGKLVYENFFLLRVDVDACGDVGFHLVLVELRCFLGGERLGLFLFRGVSPSGDSLDLVPVLRFPCAWSSLDHCYTPGVCC